MNAESDDTMMTASILLLTKNGRRDLERMLPVLFDGLNTTQIEVIAIDSGSTDGTLDLLRRFPLSVFQVPAEEFHHARTRNLAAGLAHGRILVFLSQDAIPASCGWLTSLLSNFDDPSVGAVYGRQIPKPGSSVERQDALDTIYGDRKVIKDPAVGNSMGYRFYHFSDANSAIRRSVWDAVRFPEDLKVFEDLGIAKLILDRGWKIVYEPEAAVFHSHSHTTVGLFMRYFDIGYTFKLLKVWDLPGTKKSMLQDAWKLLRRKLARRADQPAAGQGIHHDIAKSVGLLLGKHESFLPLVLKRRLSAFRVFG